MNPSLVCNSLLCLAVTSGLLLLTGTAGAGLTEFTDPDVTLRIAGGWVSGEENTATDAFLSAVGPITEHTGFAADKDGVPYPAEYGVRSGDDFSYLAVLSSPNDPEPTLVEWVADLPNGKERVGATAFAGRLDIRFDDPVIAVGLGLVALDTSMSIKVYEGEVELYSDTGVSDNTFTFIGFLADSGDRIDRVELDGFAYAIQDLTIVVPEPGTTAQSLAVIAVLALIARVRSRGPLTS